MQSCPPNEWPKLSFFFAADSTHLKPTKSLPIAWAKPTLWRDEGWLWTFVAFILSLAFNSSCSTPNPTAGTACFVITMRESNALDPHNTYSCELFRYIILLWCERFGLRCEQTMQLTTGFAEVSVKGGDTPWLYSFSKTVFTEKEPLEQSHAVCC